MTTTLLLTLGLIPSMFLLFVMLTTFSDSTRAYAAISLVPLALGLTVIALRSLSVEPSQDYWWPDLYEKIVWASVIQTGLGIGLILRACYRRAASCSLGCGYSLDNCARLAARNPLVMNRRKRQFWRQP